MSDPFYNLLVFAGRFPLWATSRPTILHAHRIPRTGGFVLASNHASHYDIPALMRSTPRNLDFLSIREFFAKPFVGWLFKHMNAFPLDRSRSDAKTVRVILNRLISGRVVAIFPEGRLRTGNESVVHGAPFQEGVAAIARLANVPIIPAVVWGTDRYRTFTGWLPIKSTRYGVAFGEPIVVKEESDAEKQLAQAYRDLYRELTQALDRSRPA